MKMDVEGFEYEAILGSKDFFQSNILENIALGLHPDILKQRGKSESDILEFLSENGYKHNKEYETLALSKIVADYRPDV